ncbi:MAG: hypothetical protein KAV00_17330, partial [Phycisphaerae bacterium]|nr:hypothetical protein [Phycisphaerae bacterium]
MRTWFFVIIAIAFTVGGVYLFMEARAHKSKVDQAKQATPIQLTVDLSKPGKFHGSFKQTFTGAHCQYLKLQIQPEFSSEEELKEALQELEGTLTLTNAYGEEVWRDELSSDTVNTNFCQETGSYLFISMRTVPLGTYRLTVEVTNGAAGLSGRKQTLIAKYFLCGLLHLEISIVRLLAVGCWVVATAIALVLFFLRRRRSRKTPAADN